MRELNRLKGIKNIADFKELLLLHKESIKKAALPVTVAAALLFFWISGNNGRQTEIDEVSSPPTGITAEEESYGDGTIESDNYYVENMDIYIDIGGCVYNPGVYKVKAGTRLFEVIEKAGGLTDDADIDSINRAEEVYDGQKIIIYSVESDEEHGGLAVSPQQDSDGRRNIKTADSLRLQEIPGVGPTTAQKIIDYRESNGKYKSIEDIKNVSGIGDKTFENLKDYITV